MLIKEKQRDIQFLKYEKGSGTQYVPIERVKKSEFEAFWIFPIALFAIAVIWGVFGK